MSYVNRIPRSVDPTGGGVVDPNTVLLMHCEGSGAAFVDSALGGNAPHALTAAGSCTQSTEQFKFGSKSAKSDNSAPNDYVYTPADSDFAFGVGNFTIEFWVRFNSVSGVYMMMGYYSGGVGWYYYFDSAIGIRVYSNVGIDFSSGGTWAANTWYHLAWVRNGDDHKIYQNGTSLVTHNNAAAMPVGSQLEIAGWSVNSTHLNGFMDEIRISTSARWTSNFTPPVGPYTPYL